MITRDDCARELAITSELRLSSLVERVADDMLRRAYGGWAFVDLAYSDPILTGDDGCRSVVRHELVAAALPRLRELGFRADTDGRRLVVSL